MKLKPLGLAAIICAPFLFIDFATSEPNVSSWKTGLFGFIYMCGWMCSIVALRQIKALGTSRWATIATTVQLILLSLAQCWNIWVMFERDYSNPLFAALDACWPLSNVWMLAIGITALRARVLHGWKRYVPLIVGLWFPITIIPAMAFNIYFLAGPYSALAFASLGFVVYTYEKMEPATYEAPTELQLL